MKRYDTVDPVDPTVEPEIGPEARPETRPEFRPMVGQLIGPVAKLDEEAHRAGNIGQGMPCYRLEKLLSREVGKRTFLATDVRSNARVSIKLLLYCPDPQEKEIEAAQTQQRNTQPYELSAMLPYLTSFEVETTLGACLALVKPYADQTSVSPQYLSGQSSVYRSNSSSEVQRITATPTSQQASVTPQTAYADFRVQSSAERFSLRCPKSRICEGIVADEPRDRVEVLAVWLLAILGTVVFVGGTVAFTGSIALGVVIATLLPVLFRPLITPSHAPRTPYRAGYRTGPRTAYYRTAQEQAIIRLSRESKGRTHLSLTTASMPRSAVAGAANAPIESRLHYSRLSVKAVTIAPAFFFDGWKLSGAKLTVTFYNHDAPSSRLCIIGTYQEIRWIHRHLLQWSKAGGSSQ